jgi:hypothetical protein
VIRAAGGRLLDASAHLRRQLVGRDRLAAHVAADRRRTRRAVVIRAAAAGAAVGRLRSRSRSLSRPKFGLAALRAVACDSCGPTASRPRSSTRTNIRRSSGDV